VTFRFDTAGKSVLLLAALLIGSSVRAAPFQAKSGKLKKVVTSGKLVVGLQKNYFPFEIDPNDAERPGIDIELIQRLAGSLGVRFELRYGTIRTLLNDVDSGRVDIAFGGISSNLARARRVSFSEPYLVTSPALLLARSITTSESESTEFDRTTIRNFDDLRKLGALRIGVMKGTTNEAFLSSDETFEIHTIVPFTDRTRLVDALRKGEIHALFGDEVNLRSLLLTGTVPSIRYRILSDTKREEHISIALPRGEIELELYLNFFLKELRRTGELREIIEKYTRGAGQSN